MRHRLLERARDGRAVRQRSVELACEVLSGGIVDRPLHADREINESDSGLSLVS